MVLWVGLACARLECCWCWLPGRGTPHEVAGRQSLHDVVVRCHHHTLQWLATCNLMDCPPPPKAAYCWRCLARAPADLCSCATTQTHTLVHTLCLLCNPAVKPCRVMAEVEDSVQFADESPKPEKGQLLENVFADPRGFGISADGRYRYELPGFTSGTAQVS